MASSMTPSPHTPADGGAVSPLQERMLAETDWFHFDSGGDNAHLFNAAWDLERRGLLEIKTSQYSQHAVYNCRPIRKAP